MRRSSFETTRVVLIASLFVLFASAVDCSAESDRTLISDIERMAGQGEHAPPEQVKSIIDRIEANTSFVTESLLPRLKDTESGENLLAAYVWALGIAGDQQSAEPIITLARQSQSQLVDMNCLQALSRIGGQRAGEFLLSRLDETTSEDTRYFIIDMLAEMQYEAALPKTEEILRKDSKQYYWQPIFIFGKMGDKAVPFLLTKISAEDRNVRWHAVHVLGLWLIPVEAVQPLRNQYWKEEDTEIKTLILSSLERVTPVLEGIKEFSEEVIRRDKDEALKEFARETIANMEEMKKKIESFRNERDTSAGKFQQEYDRLFKSMGKEGDYDVLSAASSKNDIPRLKKLRERILQRNSDESFYDYEDVNTIIILHRLSGSGVIN